jgi:hypothetical protein
MPCPLPAGNPTDAPSRITDSASGDILLLLDAPDRLIEVVSDCSHVSAVWCNRYCAVWKLLKNGCS